MNTIVEMKQDGTTVTIPIERYGMTMRLPREYDSPPEQMEEVRDQFGKRLARLEQIGWTVHGSPTIDVTDNFLMNAYEYRMTVEVYVSLTNTTEVDRQVHHDCHPTHHTNPDQWWPLTNPSHQWDPNGTWPT